MSKDEVWRDVKGYEGQYQVSNKGNVRSVDRINHIGRRHSGRTLRSAYSADGYPQVALCKNGKMKTKYIHRLVAEAFIPNPNNSPQINHIDEVKDNNNVENLEWCTSKYNINHGTRNERVSKKVRAVNIKNGEVLTFSSTSEAGRKGHNQSAVAAACKGVYKSPNGNLIGGDGRTYKGHRWYYIEEENK